MSQENVDLARSGYEAFNRRQDVERIYDLDDHRVLGLVTFRGRGRESGIDVELRYAHIFTVREGLVTHIEGFLSGS